MLPRSRHRPRWCRSQINRSLVIQKRVAGLFLSTEKDFFAFLFLQFYKKRHWCATVFWQPHLFWYKASKNGSVHSRCRSPPLVSVCFFIFKKTEIGGLLMKEINLRDFYPEIYHNDCFINLPDETVDVLEEYRRKEAAYLRRGPMSRKSTN